MSFVRATGRGRWQIAPQKKGASLIPNTLNLRHIEGCLQAWRTDHPPEEGTLVDAGAGAMPYAPVYRPLFAKAIAFDYPDSLHPNPHLDFHGDITDIPLGDQVADVVLCSEVLEHVPEPAKALSELHRILKPGGHLILTTPMLEGIHEAPHDFYRYTCFGLRHLCEQAGFEETTITPRGERLGLHIHLAAQLQMKVWRRLARWTKLPWHSVWNPLVFLGVRLPQVAYLRVLARWQTCRQGGICNRLLRWSQHYPLGYMTRARKAAS